MPAKQKTVQPDVIDIGAPVATAKKVARIEGLAMIPPIQDLVEQLIIDTPEDYLSADSLFGRIKQARRTWGERMERIIRPIRVGLDELYSLNREVDKPLATLESAVEVKMKAFKVEERRKEQAIEAQRILEEQRLQRELDAKREKEDQARTKQMREKLAAAREQLEVKLAETQQAPPPEKVVGQFSSSRVAKKIRVIDKKAFIVGVAEGDIPRTELLEVNQTVLNKLFKENPADVAEWPGVEVYDDLSIVGR